MASRFGPMRMIDGVAVTSAAGSFSTLTTLGDGRNSPHSVIVGQPGASPLTPPMEFAAEVAAVVARFGATDPARPFQTLALSHALSPAEADLFIEQSPDIVLERGGLDAFGFGEPLGHIGEFERSFGVLQPGANGFFKPRYQGRRFERCHQQFSRTTEYQRG